MRNDYTLIKTIRSLERLNLSGNGGPRFRVTFTDGTSANTEPDASINWEIENSEYQNVRLRVTFNRDNRIIGLQHDDS